MIDSRDSWLVSYSHVDKKTWDKENRSPSQSQSVRPLCRRMHVTRITQSQANIRRLSNIVPRFSVNIIEHRLLSMLILFSHALQTCCRATQKGPRSGGREFPRGVNLLQWHCRIHQPLIRKHAYAGIDQRTNFSAYETFCIISLG